MNTRIISRPTRYIPLKEDFDLYVSTNNKPIKKPWLKESEKVPEPLGFLTDLPVLSAEEMISEGEKRFFSKLEVLRKHLTVNKIKFNWDNHSRSFLITVVKPGPRHVLRRLTVDEDTHNYVYTEEDRREILVTKKIGTLIERLDLVEKYGDDQY